MVSNIIETTKFLDKKLIFHFKIEEISLELFDKIIVTSKWLGFEDWLQIYDQIQKKLSYCTSALDLENISSNLKISNNVDLKITSDSLKSSYKKILSLDEGDVVPIFLTILVRQRISRGCSQCNKKGKLKIKKDLFPEYDPVKVGSRVKSDIAYAPYKPSTKLTDNQVDDVEKERYSPKPLAKTEESSETPAENLEQSSSSRETKVIPTYKPSTILKTESLDYASEDAQSLDAFTQEDKDKSLKMPPVTRGSIKRKKSTDTSSPSNSAEKSAGRETRYKKIKQQVDKKKIKGEVDLFGSYSENEDGPSSNIFSEFEPSKINTNKNDNIDPKLKNKDDYIKNKKKTSSSSSENQNKLYSKYDKLKKRSEKTNDEKTKSTSTSSKHSSRENGSSKLSKKDKSSKAESSYSPTPKNLDREALEKEMEQLIEFNEKMEALNTNAPETTFELLTLDHIDEQDLMGTFDEYKSKLDKYFENYKKQKTHQVKREKDLDPLLIMNIIKRSKLLPMVNHLKDVYVTDDKNSPSYTDLFMEQLLPEWIIRIFMKEHQLSRSKAIERMKLHNRVDAEVDDSSFEIDKL